MFRLAPMICLCVVVGCGPADGLERAQITGMLTVQGKPLPGAVLSFQPMEGTKGPGALGNSNAKGEFTVISSRENHEGIPPGKYRVRVSRIVMGDGRPLPPDAAPADYPFSQESVPPPYSGVNSPLTVEIPKDGGHVKVDIPAKLLVPVQ